MAITKVWIDEGCTACGLCETICPEVFRMDDLATVIESTNPAEHEEMVIDAASSCPAEVIKYE